MDATNSFLSEKDIRHHVAENEPEKALAALAAWLDAHDLPELQDDLALQTAKWKNHEDHRLDGSLSAERLVEQKSQIDKALLDINRRLFQKLKEAQIVPANTPQPPKGGADAGELAPSLGGRRVQGIREDKFKVQVFVLMILTKAAVIGWVFFHEDSGGLSRQQALATVALLLPVFSVYTAAMFNDFLQNRHVTDKKTVSPYIKNSLRWLTYALFPVYAFLLMKVIGTCAREYVGEKNAMEELSKWLGLIETGLGVYVGKIVFALFKKD